MNKKVNRMNVIINRELQKKGMIFAASRDMTLSSLVRRYLRRITRNISLKLGE